MSIYKNIIAQQITRKRGIFKKHLVYNKYLFIYLFLVYFLYTKCFLNMPLLRVICWAIIFLTRIRFPPGVSIAEYIYRVYKIKLNRFEIALNFAKQLLVSSFYIYGLFGYL